MCLFTYYAYYLLRSSSGQSEATSAAPIQKLAASGGNRAVRKAASGEIAEKGERRNIHCILAFSSSIIYIRFAFSVLKVATFEYSRTCSDQNQLKMKEMNYEPAPDRTTIFTKRMDPCKGGK